MQRLIYILKRVNELGFLNTFERIQAKTHKKIYKFTWKNVALKKAANHSWQTIAKKHELNTSFSEFFEKIKQKSLLQKTLLHKNILQKSLFQKILCSKEFVQILPKDTEYSNTFVFNKLAQKVESKKNILEFYQDIKIEQKECNTFDKYNFDIKIPWEESRFQSSTTQEQINNWINNNPYLLGENWVCPMEVAIRAINWIYWFYIENKSYKATSFIEKFICSLYDHAQYLKNNWETSDKPNNHYLADLIGYFYLCFLFENLNFFKKEKEKTYKKILEQFDHQIQSDGTSYEGSTNYHKLVTEIFAHFYILCKTNNINLPSNFLPKLKKMFLFQEHCTDNSGNFVQIGDNDSGKILNSIKDLQKKDSDSISHHYPNFGLTIIKNKNWHISYRHPTFNKKQPSGHFHQDDFSITLSILGIPVLVDPGTYVYTANTKWRNLFRSYKMHNTFYFDSLHKSLDHFDLFQLPKTEQIDSAKITKNKNLTIIQNYKKHQNNLVQFRKLTFDQKKNLVEIQDWWKDKKNLQSNQNCSWNFIFHPNIRIQKEKNYWRIFYTNKEILKLESNLDFKVENGFYSSGYSKLKKCAKLGAKQKVDTQKNFVFIKLV
ncbi:heparinase II/III family protein [Candidatus Dependentiae bacterium]